MKIEGVIVLYNPDIGVVENIKSYVDEIDKLYIVDNSENKNIELINKIEKISNKCCYINNNGNQGIANALNIGAKLAIKNDADWLLTMDQDSAFSENSSLHNLLECLKKIDTKIDGILSPVHITKDKKDIARLNSSIYEEVSVMTSGNLLNLKIFQTVGLFVEKYFIDYVDHEYCLRLRKNGYKVKVCGNSYLTHELGNIDSQQVFFKNIVWTNHNALRRYYMTRNRLDVIQKYIFSDFIFCIKIIKALISEWIKIMLFEKNKVETNKMIFKTTKDYLRGQYGKYK